MVATDAIGMGLNLYVTDIFSVSLNYNFHLFNFRSIKRIIFYSLVKPQLNEQGEKEKDSVTTSQALQIAGRAGRFENIKEIIKL
jgi:ATP-dependent RNA helicase SUPV3L1/SUV3